MPGLPALLARLLSGLSQLLVVFPDRLPKIVDHLSRTYLADDDVVEVGPVGLAVREDGLARALKVTRPRLNDLVRGRRGVTIDTALRLGRYFGTTPEFWINLQTRYDLDVAEHTVRDKIELQIEPHAA